MSANSKIEWTTHTFNPWEGCQKVGPGCDHCYAENRNARFGGGVAINWGPGAPRRRTSASNWAKPLAWNANHAAFFAENGHRQRVFCASLADVFDNTVPVEWRMDLFSLIADTPNLDWLILTKRIGNVMSMCSGDGLMFDMICNRVWLGATIVNQEEADRDIPKLLAVPAAKRFLSMEPLLGPVDIKKWLAPWTCSNCGHHGSEDEGGPCVCDHCGVKTVYDKSDGSDHCPVCNRSDEDQGVGFACPVCERASNWDHDYCLKFDREYPLDWVICGGESGPGARPMHPDWARSLRDQCDAAGVPFLFKQWGEWKPISQMDEADHSGLYKSKVIAKPHEDQGNLDDIYGRRCIVPTTVLHADGTVHDITEPMAFGQGTDAMQIFCVGKKSAGRLLDGRTWDGYPNTQSPD